MVKGGCSIHLPTSKSKAMELQHITTGEKIFVNNSKGVSLLATNKWKVVERKPVEVAPTTKKKRNGRN